MGLIYIDMAQKTDAVENLRRAIELDPDNIEYRKDLDQLEQTSDLMLQIRSFRGSWGLMGFLSIMAFFSVLIMLSGAFGPGLMNIIFWGGGAYWYWRRQTT